MMKKIEELRKELDSIDTELVKIILKRIHVAESIVRIKRENGINVDDLEREESILDKISKQAGKNSPLLTDLFRKIFSWVKRESH